ncbi:hypothetical protein MHA_2589 [Mannheimia haemolytica PHL213]|nr:hypothetical protein MHA_2589 [Mannheimia haemolytica PHL213]
MLDEKFSFFPISSQPVPSIPRLARTLKVSISTQMQN